MSNRMAVVFIALVLFVIVVVIFESSTTQLGQTEALYYPDTSAAPTLKFKWDSSSLSLGQENSQIYSCGHPSLNTETGELNQEMSIFFIHRHRDSIYAFCDGVITYLKEWENFEDAAEANRGGEIWIRYGMNYAIGYRHVVTAGLDFSEGSVVEAGEVIGYGADLKFEDPMLENENGIFFEFVFTQRDDNHFYYLNPFYFFDNESQSILIDIWNSAIRRDGMGEVPWGDNLKYETDDGNQEIPFKGGFF